MSRHSKNNTASSVFTYHERQMMGYGTKKARLGADSIKPFDACCICLSTLVDPLSCSQGHLFCRECIVKNLIAQKQTKKREMKKFLEHEKQRQALEKEEEEKRKKEEFAKFEKANSGLLPSTKAAAVDSAKTKPTAFFSVKDEKGEIVQASMETRREISKTGLKTRSLHESSEAFSSDLNANSFWVPQTLKDASDEVKKPSLATCCPEGNHSISRKNLIEVKFTPCKGDSEERFMCNTCSKVLSNSVKCVLMGSCGHVVCSFCNTNFVKPEKKCSVCNRAVRSKEVIELQAGGTGFAAHNKVEAKVVSASARV